jgi:hypothetical protein
VRISWRCISGECEPSRCAPFCKSAEGRSLWHNATQAANTRKEVTQIDAIRLHHSSVLHSGKRLCALGDSGRKHASTLAPHVAFVCARLLVPEDRDVPLLAIPPQRTGELAAIVTIRMFVAILPVCSLLRAPYLVEGTISLMPFLPPVPVPAIFPVIPLMVVPMVAVVVPPLVSFVSLSGILTAIVSKIVSGLDPRRGNKCHTQEK